MDQANKSVDAIASKSVLPVEPNQQFPSDAEIWADLPAGSGHVNTGDGVDPDESLALLVFAAKSPEEFAKRLYKDSMNGTPVTIDLKPVQEMFMPQRGTNKLDLSAAFKVNKGAFELDAKLKFHPDGRFAKSLREEYGAAVDQNNKSVDATIQLKGHLGADGNLNGLSLTTNVENIPALSIKKLIGLKKAQDDIKQLLAQPASNPQVQEENIARVLGRLAQNNPALVVDFLREMARGRSPMTIKATNADGVEVEFIAADNKVTFTILNIFGKKPDLLGFEGKIAAAIGRDQDTLTIQDAHVSTQEKFSVENMGSRPTYYVQRDGKRVDLNENAILVALLPLVIPILAEVGFGH